MTFPSILDVLDFIRFKISFFSAFVGVLGFLLTNQISYGLLFAGLASFFVCAGGFAYNSMTDIKEDSINRRKVNPLAKTKSSFFLIFIIFSLGLLSSTFLSVTSILLYLLMVTIGAVYSFFRLKAYMLVKNIYIGFCVPVLFLLGAGTLDAEVIYYYLLLSLFFFTGSIIADLRDYVGDNKVGLKTIPVVLGYKKTQMIVSFLLLGVSISILYLKLYYFSPIVFLSFLMLIFLLKDKPEPAHFVGSLSILTTVIWWFL